MIILLPQFTLTIKKVLCENTSIQSYLAFWFWINIFAKLYYTLYYLPRCLKGKYIANQKFPVTIRADTGTSKNYIQGFKGIFITSLLRSDPTTSVRIPSQRFRNEDKKPPRAYCPLVQREIHYFALQLQTIIRNWGQSFLFISISAGMPVVPW